MSLNTTRPTNELESPLPSAIPGAFPTDDMSGNFTAADSTGSQRNKLHKPNDPRGWDQDQTSRAQQSTDSGIGMPQSSAASGARDNTYQGSQFGRNPQESSNDRYDGMAGAPTSGLGEIGQFQRQQAQSSGMRDNNSPFSEGHSKDSTTIQTGTGAGPGSALSKPGEGGNTSTSEDPYWGDLPRGAGVYNTVIGHGSNEDDQSHAHRGSEHAAADSVGAAGTSSYGSNQQREFPLTGQSQTTHGYGTDSNREQARDLGDRKDDDRRKGLYEAGGAAALASAAHHTSRDDSRQQTRDLNDPKDDDRRKGLYEAGGVAAVGSAAYPIARSQEQERQDKYDKHDKHDKHAEKAREAEKPKEQKESKLKALFHRDSSDKDEKPKEKKEHTRHEKQTETVVPAATRRHDDQPQAQDYSRSTEQSQFGDNRQKDIDSKDSKVKEGLGLGAAGAAAYGATRYAEKEHNKPDAASSGYSNQTADYRQTENLSSSQQPITNDYGNRSAADSKYNALSSGTASGVKQDDIGGNANTLSSNSRAEPSTSHTARDTAAVSAASAAVIGSQYDKSSHPSSTAADKRDVYPADNREQQYATRSVFDTRDAQPTSRSEQPYESYKEQHYEPSREQQQQYTKPYQEQQYTKSSMTEEAPKESRNREAMALGGGAAAATGAAALASKSHASPSERAETTHSKSTTSPINKKPGASAENDQYNHLASGTPSGINLEH